MRLWDFALEFYRREGVADACLHLQDQAGVDVNILLYALWCVVDRNLEITHADIASADMQILEWRTRIVQPLRALRRSLKSGPPPAPGRRTEALRQRIKTCELHAEHIELDLIETLAPPPDLSQSLSRDARAAAAISAVVDFFSEDRTLDLSGSVAAVIEAI